MSSLPASALSSPGKKLSRLTLWPLIVKDMVITGIAGGEYGIRGFLDAYDAATGKRRRSLPLLP